MNTNPCTYYKVSWAGWEGLEEFHDPDPTKALQQARNFATYSLQDSGFKDIKILKVTTELVEILNPPSHFFL